MISDLLQVKTVIMDCDGVILNSNSIKTDAFYEVALPYGERNAEVLVEYHKQFGGISRFKKFSYFFQEIIRKDNHEAELRSCLEQFEQLVKTKLLSCSETEGLREFMESLPPDAYKAVVSGGMQSELREVFEERRLSCYFNGIYGSPDSKVEIMQQLVQQGKINFPAVFIGDSRYDFEVADQFGLDFVFMSKYSEFKEWQAYFAEKSGVSIVSTLTDLAKQTACA